MSNYPPGTSASDPRAPWNDPDMSHDHEWRPIEDESPRFEDGYVMFGERCIWENVQNAERGYEGEMVVTESIPCGEERWVKFEPTTIEPTTSVWTYEVPGPHAELPAWAEDVLVGLELNEDERTLLDVDPDPDLGCVVVEYDGYEVTFEPTED